MIILAVVTTIAIVLAYAVANAIYKAGECMDDE